jgi:hypothetical protein
MTKNKTKKQLMSTNYEEQTKFKVLTSFLNSYKNKLMIGNLSTSCKAKQKRDLARLYYSQDINSNDFDKPLSLDQLKDRKLENEQEITLDYE